MFDSTTSHTSGMIALVPSDADLDRLALPGGEPRDELHLTLWFLGDAATYDATRRDALGSAITELVARREVATLPARAFGVAHWNPTSDDPAWVLNVGDVATDARVGDTLGSLRATTADALDEVGVRTLVPEQHSPWQPHVCITYSSDDLLATLEARLGDLAFDRVRVAFGDEITDVQLAQPATVAAGSGGDRVPWHKVHQHDDCPTGEPWAVVKDATGEVEGCHASEAEADDQLAALYANEGDAGAATLVEEVPTVPQVTDAVALAATETNEAGDYGCPPGQHRMPDGSCMSDEDMATESRWFGVLAIEGAPTGDGREFAPGALTWAEAPLLRWQKEGAHGGQHDVTVTVGRIDQVWRDGNQIMGRGVLDLLSVDGFELYRRLRGGFAGGISIDADDIAEADVEFVWADDPDDEAVEEDGSILKLLFGSPEKMIFHGGRIRAATCVDIPAFVEACIALTGVDGDDALVAASTPRALVTHHTETSDEPWVEHATAPSDAFAWVADERRLIAHHEVVDDVVGSANLTACAVGIAQLNGERPGCDVPASDRAAVYEHLATHLRDAGREPPPPAFDALVTVAASGDGDDVHPPRTWFEDPKLSVPIGITITDQGRVYGHVAQWGECHIGHGDTCVTPPFEEAHPYFMTGEVICADGSRVAVGQITVGTGHAPLGYRASRAAEHYDNTGCAVADVVVGNDDVGIWVAGAVRPFVEAARVHDLRASGQVSGDWRRIGGALRLVGLLAVNVPGFPVPRLRARVASGVPVALVAAGHTAVGTRAEPPPSDAELDRRALRRVMDMLVTRVHQDGELNLAGEVEGVR